MGIIEYKDTNIKEVKVITSDVFPDDRGYFKELYRRDDMKKYGIDVDFKQDNYSVSSYGVIRGLHYQKKYPQIKLVSVLKGSIIDVAVDIRVGSPTFGKHVSCILSEHNHRSLYIPEGFAHGFSVISDFACVMYKCSDYYVPGDDEGILWSDPDIGIDWDIKDPILSTKDMKYKNLIGHDKDKLPRYLGGI